MDLHELLDKKSLRWIWLAGPAWHPFIASVVSVFTLLADMLSGHHNIFRIMQRLRPDCAGLAFSFRHHYYANRALYNYGWLLYAQPRRITEAMAEVNVIGVEHCRRAFATGEAIVAFSAHVGCFLNAVFCERLTRQLGDRMLVLLSPDNRTTRKLRIATQMRDVLPGLNVQLIDIQTISNAVEILRALQNKAVVACTLDYAYDFTKNKVVRFLGRNVEFPIGLIELGRRIGVTYLPCFSYIANGRTTVEFMEPFASVKSGNRDDDIDAVAARINSALEKKILAVPDQWSFWIRLYYAEPASI